MLTLVALALLPLHALASEEVTWDRAPASTADGGPNLKKMICGSIAVQYKLGSKWARQECQANAQFNVAQKQNAAYRGKNMVMRLRGGLRAKVGTCDWQIERQFPGAVLLPNGSVKERRPFLSLTSSKCTFNQNKVPHFAGVSTSHPSVKRITWDQANRIIKNPDVDLTPAFMLGDGYYDCKEGQWFVSNNEMGQPRGLIWEGLCYYTEGDSEEFEPHDFRVDLQGEFVD